MQLSIALTAEHTLRTPPLRPSLPSATAAQSIPPRTSGASWHAASTRTVLSLRIHLCCNVARIVLKTNNSHTKSIFNPALTLGLSTIDVPAAALPAAWLKVLRLELARDIDRRDSIGSTPDQPDRTRPSQPSSLVTVARGSKLKDSAMAAAPCAPDPPPPHPLISTQLASHPLTPLHPFAPLFFPSPRCRCTERCL